MGLVSAEEFKRRRDIIEKGISPNNTMLVQSSLRKRKPELSTQSLLRTKNIGQLSFADEEGEEMPILPKKKKPVAVEPVKVVVEEEPKQQKPKINLLEEDEETRRMKQEAIQVIFAY